MRIDFHNTTCLEKVSYSHSFSPGTRPGRLCRAASPSILLYEDQSRDPREVRWLNCTTWPPKLANPAPGTLGTHTQQDIIWDMCYVKVQDANLVVTTRGYNGIYGYNVMTNKLQWHVKGKLGVMKQELCAEALTTDGRCHLFVGDRDNSCIQMFAADGSYIGPLTPEGRQSMEQPLQLRWNKSKSSLVVAHTTKTERYAISVIPVNIESSSASGTSSTSGTNSTSGTHSTSGTSSTSGDMNRKTTLDTADTGDEELVVTDTIPGNKGSDVVAPRKVGGLTFEGNASSLLCFS